MADRTRLHELVESLPEEALAVALGALEHYQKWPPEPPPQIRAMREAQTEKMRQSMRPGMAGGGGGGGSYRMGPGGRIEYGRHGHSHWEDGDSVDTTHHFFAGHEVLVEQRLRLEDDGSTLVHVDTVTGPDGTVAGPREIRFRVKR